MNESRPEDNRRRGLRKCGQNFELAMREAVSATEPHKGELGAQDMLCFLVQALESEGRISPVACQDIQRTIVNTVAR